MPRWRGMASGSVFTRTARTLPSTELVIHCLVPVTTYSSPSRTARVRIACRSVPQSGSVRAMPPRSSPRARRGRNASLSGSVPKRSIALHMMRCELKMPETDIHTAETRSTIFA